MKMKRRIFLTLALPVAFLITIFSSSCDKWDKNYENGVFPDSAVNLESANTRFDDYNSSGPPTIGYNFGIMFSTNRATEGDSYDLISYSLYIQFDQHYGTLDVYGSEGYNPYFYLTNLANSPSNEFGPTTIAYTQQDFLFLFSSDRTGNMEIYASAFDQFTFSGGPMYNPSAFELRGLNSDYYDAYPTFLLDASQVIFCSNRDGNLDFYRHYIEYPTNLEAWAKQDTIYPVEPVEVLNSMAADVCPYINGKLLVFTSKRSGGYGGYDLYYSILGESDWSEPVNFGPSVNTEYDEFRPVIFFAPKFENDMMIFSSNRPGGKGGYDLYYVGIDKMMQ